MWLAHIRDSLDTSNIIAALTISTLLLLPPHKSQNIDAVKGPADGVDFFAQWLTIHRSKCTEKKDQVHQLRHARLWSTE